MTQTFDMDVGL